jgi:triphosphoribosyl-dephospho-CoA synthase
LSASAATVAEAFIGACHDELEAPKPGNVHVFSPGHGWTAADFERSAEAAAPSIARPGATVGERIFGAVGATHAAIGHNTNLGIVLLCAPLAAAAERCAGSLRQATQEVLAALDVQDAEFAFRAIALAAPGGLGRAAAHDVFEPAAVSLLDAMIAAAARDSIARQYANGFADIFDFGAPLFDAARRRWGGNVKGAALAAYLGFLATFPDTHIQRKYGHEAALAVQTEAAALHAAAQNAEHPAPIFARALALDARLKARGLNPGSSADLTVATLFYSRLAAGGQDGLG